MVIKLTKDKLVGFLAAYGMPGSPPMKDAQEEFPRLYQRQLEDAEGWLNENFVQRKKKNNGKRATPDTKR